MSKMVRSDRAGRCSDRGIPLQLRLLLLVNIVIALLGAIRSFAVEQPSDIPAWLRPNVGEGEGQIAQVVLQRRARASPPKSARGRGQKSLLFCHGRYASPRSADGKLGPRFHVICGRPIVRCDSAGHGAAAIQGIVDFANGQAGARRTSAMRWIRRDGRWAYVTAETRTSFKGYYGASAKQDAVLIRCWFSLRAKAKWANARQREIGGHVVQLLRNVVFEKIRTV